MARSRQQGRQAKTPKAEKKAAKAARAAEAKKCEDVQGKPANGGAVDSSSNKRKRDDTDSQGQQGPTQKQRKQQKKVEEKLKKLVASVNDPSINPIQALDLYRHNQRSIEYKELGGTPFKMVVTVDGVRYEGEGETSKEAKNKAAQAAVKAVVEKLKAGEGWEVKF